jgi:hypothetical protein
MINLLEIVDAWIEAENPGPERAIIAESRVQICNTCPEKTYIKTFDTYVCGVCNCPINKKIFSYKPGPEACPKQKWKI